MTLLLSLSLVGCVNTRIKPGFDVTRKAFINKISAQDFEYEHILIGADGKTNGIERIKVKAPMSDSTAILETARAALELAAKLAPK